MRYNFTQLPDKLPYPPNLKGKLSTIHSDMVEAVVGSYIGTFNQRRKIVELFNTVSYYVLDRNTEFDRLWKPSDLFNNIQIVDQDKCKSKLGSLYLIERDINWDIKPVESKIISDNKTVGDSTIVDLPKVPDSVISNKIVEYSSDVIVDPTPKSDLYIQPPVVPRFNVKKVYAAGTVDDCTYAVYFSEPEIPKRQNEISLTTDVNKMTDSDLRRLYPNRVIRTRSSAMYDEYPGIAYHSILGSIIPIDGFSEDEVVDNMVKYPHLFRLSKVVDSNIVSFYTTIEIDGELFKISDVWNSLPESSVIPYNTDFIKEYVVRRYLLERDIRGVVHKNPMYGSLDPYLTLFARPSDYIAMGYEDVVGIAKKCVEARVEYKRSRNPVLRRLSNA